MGWGRTGRLLKGDCFHLEVNTLPTQAVPHRRPGAAKRPMRRSARAAATAASERSFARSDSPSVSELTVASTPSVSPTPEVPAVRQHATPGNRPDGAPKRPMNAFILFSNEMRSKLADMNPHMCAAFPGNPPRELALPWLCPCARTPPGEAACPTPPPGPPIAPRFRPPAPVAPLALALRSNAAVSVLLGQRWRDMHSSEKSGYVAAAKKIKEQFHADHPDAKTRCISRKGKRKADGGFGGGGRGVVARNVGPPSLHALALVGSRLNQSPHPAAAASSSPWHQSSTTWSYGGDEGEDEGYDEAEEEFSDGAAGQLTLLEQLCTVAETEHTAAAQALSAFGTG